MGIRGQTYNPHPARGRKRLSGLLDLFCQCLQPTPRKGTETLIGVIPFIFFNYNPHPARGRKYLWRRYAVWVVVTIHTPQGDGNTLRLPHHNGQLELQPTPRKGTETFFPETKASAAKITTHTPQGDGNHNRYLFLCFFVITTHTPQGDGNIGVIPFNNFDITTHTPQGDGNP